MTMPFDVASTVDLSGFAEGDPVMLEFEVRWTDGPLSLVTRLERAPDTP